MDVNFIRPSIGDEATVLYIENMVVGGVTWDWSCPYKWDCDNTWESDAEVEDSMWR